MMGSSALQDFYRSAPSFAGSGPGNFPNAKAIQELVATWKQLRKWRYRTGGLLKHLAYTPEMAIIMVASAWRTEGV